MAKALTGAVINGTSITATWTESGAPGTSTGPWPSAVTSAADALQSAVDAALGATATAVQVYTASSNPDGGSDADPGGIVDAWDGSGGNPDRRFGDDGGVPGGDGAVPDAIATARDSLKTALSAAI